MTLPGKGSGQTALDALGLEALCEKIVGGMSQSKIAKELGIGQSTLVDWIAANTARSARVKEARISSAMSYADKAEIVLLDAVDPFELSRSKELAHHYRWCAAKADPKVYGDRIQQDHSGEVTVKGLAERMREQRQAGDESGGFA